MFNHVTLTTEVDKPDCANRFGKSGLLKRKESMAIRKDSRRDDLVEDAIRSKLLKLLEDGKLFVCRRSRTNINGFTCDVPGSVVARSEHASNCNAEDMPVCAKSSAASEDLDRTVPQMDAEAPTRK